MMQPRCRSHSTRSDDEPDENRRTSSSDGRADRRRGAWLRYDWRRVKTSVSTLVPTGETSLCKMPVGRSVSPRQALATLGSSRPARGMGRTYAVENPALGAVGEVDPLEELNLAVALADRHEPAGAVGRRPAARAHRRWRLVRRRRRERGKRNGRDRGRLVVDEADVVQGDGHGC